MPLRLENIENWVIFGTSCVTAGNTKPQIPWYVLTASLRVAPARCGEEPYAFNYLRKTETR